MSGTFPASVARLADDLEAIGRSKPTALGHAVCLLRECAAGKTGSVYRVREAARNDVTAFAVAKRTMALKLRGAVERAEGARAALSDSERAAVIARARTRVAAGGDPVDVFLLEAFESPPRKTAGDQLRDRSGGSASSGDFNLKHPRAHGGKFAVKGTPSAPAAAKPTKAAAGAKALRARIAQVNALLGKLGYASGPEGIKAFQKKMGLKVTGAIDSGVLSLLNREVAALKAKPGKGTVVLSADQPSSVSEASVVGNPPVPNSPTSQTGGVGVNRPYGGAIPPLLALGRLGSPPGGPAFSNGDSVDVLARLLENAHIEALQEAAVITFDPRLHPRDRLGQFASVVGKIKRGGHIHFRAPGSENETVMRMTTGAFAARGKLFKTSAEVAAFVGEENAPEQLELPRDYIAPVKAPSKAYQPRYDSMGRPIDRDTRTKREYARVMGREFTDAAPQAVDFGAPQGQGWSHVLGDGKHQIDGEFVSAEEAAARIEAFWRAHDKWKKSAAAKRFISATDAHYARQEQFRYTGRGKGAKDVLDKARLKEALDAAVAARIAASDRGDSAAFAEAWTHERILRSRITKLTEVPSSTYPGLKRSPKKDSNWVEKAGGLPSYVERIAKHLHYEKGMEIGRSIATAVNAVKKMCATGETNLPNAGKVNSGARAEACKAVSRWESMKGGTKVKEAVALMEAAWACEDPAQRPFYPTREQAYEMAAAADAMALREGFPAALAIAGGIAAKRQYAQVGTARKFDERLHPRNRVGEFTDVLGKLKSGQKVGVKYGTGTPRPGTFVRAVGSDTAIVRSGSGMEERVHASKLTDFPAGAERAMMGPKGRAIARELGVRGMSSGTPMQLIDATERAKAKALARPAPSGPQGGRRSAVGAAGHVRPGYEGQPVPPVGQRAPRTGHQSDFDLLYRHYRGQFGAAGAQERLSGVKPGDLAARVKRLDLRGKGATAAAQGKGPGYSEGWPAMGMSSGTEVEVALKSLPLYELASMIQRDWQRQGKGVNFAAKPYLQAMGSLASHTENYGLDSGKSVIAYFLSNASSYRGETAKKLKAELKRRLREADAGMAARIDRLEEATEQRLAAAGTAEFAVALAVEQRLREAVLSKADRKRLPKGSFAIGEKAPESGSYPIHDEAHARNALARVSQHGTPAEKARVRAAVKRRYPNINQKAHA